MSNALLWDPAWRLPAPQSDTPAASPDEDSGRIFYRGLHSIPRAATDSKVAYCRDYLAEIDSEILRIVRSDSLNESLLWTRASICSELSRALAEDPAQMAAARDVLLSALSFASERNHEALIGVTLSQLGSFETEQFRQNDDEGAFARAEIYFQRAMVYAGRGPAAVLAASLGNLAQLWELKADTYMAAIKLLDWWFVLRPDALSFVFDKYRVLAIWERDNVSTVAAKKKYIGAFDAVQTAAANSALGQKHRSSAALEIGLTLAREENNGRLVESIERHLSFERTAQKDHLEYRKL